MKRENVFRWVLRNVQSHTWGTGDTPKGWYWFGSLHGRVLMSENGDIITRNDVTRYAGEQLHKRVKGRFPNEPAPHMYTRCVSVPLKLTPPPPEPDRLEPCGVSFSEMMKGLIK